MPRFYFDTYNGGHIPDDVGTECADLGSACVEAMAALPEIARFAIPASGDNQAFTVLVRDEDGTAVYTATLTLVGAKLTACAA